jgi:hypothetical protein
MACELAGRLEQRGMVRRKVLVMLDIAAAEKCDDLAHRLRGLAQRFAKWPDAAAEVVAFERVTIVPELMSLQREAEELLCR